MQRHTIQGISIIPGLSLIICILIAFSSILHAEPRKVKVGIYQNEPKVFIDEHGKAKGFYIDIIENIARKENADLEYVIGTWAQNLKRLENGEIDLLVDIAYSKERAELFDFNDETVLSNWTILYVQDSSEIKSILDLRHKKIAALEGGISYTEFQKTTKRFRMKIDWLETQDYLTAIELVHEKKVDAALISRLFGYRYEDEYDVKRSPIVCCPSDLRFAAPKGKNADILKVIDHHLKEMKANRHSVYDRAMFRWIEGKSTRHSVRFMLTVLAVIIGLVVFLLVTIKALKARIRKATEELSQQNALLQEEIEQRKQAEQAVRDSEQRFRVLTNSTSAAIFIINSEPRIIFANQTALDDLGYSEQELYTLDPMTILDEDSRNKMAHVLESFSSNKSLPKAIELHTYNIHGKEKWIEMTVGSVEVRGESLWITTSFNITERKRAQIALLQREAILKSLANAAGHLLSDSSWKDNILEILYDLGEATKVSRVYIFKNLTLDEDKLGSELQFEWADKGVNRLSDTPDLKRLPYGQLGFENWRELLESGNLIHTRVSELSEQQRKVLQRQNIRSISLFPIFVDESWWGFIGFDDCENERQWSQAVLDALKMAASLIGASVGQLRSKNALIESEQKFRVLAESTPAGIHIAQGENLIYYNQATLDQLDMTDEEFQNFSDEDFLKMIHPSCIDDFQEMIKAHRQGEPWPDRMELGIITKKGEERWIESSSGFFEIEGVEAIIQTSFDITDRKMAELAIKESENKYRTIFETTGTATVIFDDDEIIQLANTEFVRLSGYPREEVEGKLAWTEVVSNEYRNSGHDRHDNASDKTTRASEAKMQNRQGQLRYGITTVNPVPGTSLRVASFLDLTRRRQAEKQMLHADKMAALGQIIAGVAHEINNPNNFIYFNLPILRRYIDAIKPHLDEWSDHQENPRILNMDYEMFLEDIYKLLENMEHGSERITGIVSELKNYIRSNEAEDKKPESLDNVIRHVMTLVGKQVRKTVKNFEVNIEKDLPPMIMNSGKIEQVLINLIINAGHAADKAKSSVSLTARRNPDSEKLLQLIVEDNGAGIPKDVLPNIFDPFFTTKGRDSGTGLGLAISNRIIEEHQGSIEVESKINEGTKFTINLPINTGVDQ